MRSRMCRCAHSPRATCRCASATVARTFSSRSRSGSEPLDSTDAQSTALPSRIAPAASTSGSWSGTPHLLGEAHERPLRGLACRISRRLAEHLRHFVVAVPHFQPGDDRLTLLRLEAVERPVVALQALPSDGLFERRLSARNLQIIEPRHIWPPSLPAQLVTNPIEHSLPEIRVQGAGMARLERLDPLERLEQRVLDKVVGVRDAARPFRKASAGPAPKRPQVPGKQLAEGQLIAGTCRSIRRTVGSGSRE